MKRTPLHFYLSIFLGLLSPFSANPVKAVTFEQQEVNQSDFIAIARPYGQNKYDLLILQQIPGQRQCWQEMTGNPTLVEPLLLNFDFTGNCERSTDSNGYSIRIDQQDYGLNYLLRLVERNGELVLVGAHRSNANQPEIIVGRTHGLSQGFLKIHLEPGWRFTKRSYQGQVLGHVYLTGDSSALRSPNPASSSVSVTPDETDSNSNGDAVRELTFTANGKPERAPSPVLPSSPPVLPTIAPSPSPGETTLSPPTPSSAPTFSELPPLPVPPQVNQSTIIPPPDPSNANRSSLSQVMTGLSRPQGGTSEVTGYRVLVNASTNNQRTQVKNLYPDAFPTRYQGRSLWQIGLFSTRENAEKALADFKNQGISGLIIP